MLTYFLIFESYSQFVDYTSGVLETKNPPLTIDCHHKLPIVIGFLQTCVLTILGHIGIIRNSVNFSSIYISGTEHRKKRFLLNYVVYW